MGLFDLPAPLFQAVDGVLGMALPDTLRLILWGILAGWLTMVLYRRLSNQEKISALKKEQKAQQQQISNFDGDFEELLPLIRHTLGLGFRQLALAIGPALLASLPILFLVAWVAGQFGYHLPEPGEQVTVSTLPEQASISFQPATTAEVAGTGWLLTWPGDGTTATLNSGANTLLALPLEAAVPVIHKKLWWNVLFANPLGYLPDELDLERVDIALRPQEFLPFGPDWLRGWMFLFFTIFLLSSVGFKLILKID
jgi:hypothetical protein